MPAPDPKRLRRAVTCAVVLNDTGQVLLQQRTDGGRWNLPGGAIEVGERADQANVREVLEETGYTVEVVRLSGVYSDPAQTTVTYPNGDVVAYVAVCFVCKVLGGAPALSSESAAVDWFDPDRLPDHFYAGHVVRFRDAIEARASATRSKRARPHFSGETGLNGHVCFVRTHVHCVLATLQRSC